jgi:hypothetical protein
MKPIAWIDPNDNMSDPFSWNKTSYHTVPLYTAPRELSDEIEALKHDNEELLKSLTAERTPRELSDDDIDLCAEETGMWCDGTPDEWDTKAIHNFARAILKKASEK